ncbi:MAG: outer membrane lipoprotein SlyB [Janthinobacterium sp.]|jgi:outer membrane lipoprotein SlyB
MPSKPAQTVQVYAPRAKINKENTMSNTPDTHRKLHPMMIVAAVAVVLFCAVGIAAMMGWLPSSIGGNASDAPIAAEVAPSPKAPEKQASKQPQAPDRVALEAACSNCGMIDSIREIKTRAEGSGVGAAGGAIVGGVLGNQIGGGTGKQLATVAGAIGGAFAGNQIEGNVKATTSYDVTVRLDNGTTRTIRQSGQPRWNAGDQVRIVGDEIRSN